MLARTARARAAGRAYNCAVHDAPLAIPLIACSGAGRALVGAKAIGLGTLAAEGLPTPGAVCLTAEAYRRFVAAPAVADALRAGDPAARDAAFTDAPLPPEVGPAIERAARQVLRLGDPVAVRASVAEGEDDPPPPPGRFPAFLNLTEPDAVARAVRRCWAALDAPAAMACLIQQCRPAEASGALLTADPGTGDGVHLHVYASWGTGTALAAGRVTPDRFVLSREGELVAQTVAHKETFDELAPTDGGVAPVPTPPGRVHIPCLSAEELLELTQLGLVVDGLLGRGQDIGWLLHETRFTLLGVRPVGSRRRD